MKPSLYSSSIPLLFLPPHRGVWWFSQKLQILGFHKSHECFYTCTCFYECTYIALQSYIILFVCFKNITYFIIFFPHLPANWFFFPLNLMFARSIHFELIPFTCYRVFLCINRPHFICLLSKRGICQGEQTVCPNKSVCNNFLGQIVKLFIGLQSYLSRQEFPGTDRQVMLISGASFLGPCQLSNIEEGCLGSCILSSPRLLGI